MFAVRKAPYKHGPEVNTWRVVWRRRGSDTYTVIERKLDITTARTLAAQLGQVHRSYQLGKEMERIFRNLPSQQPTDSCGAT